MYVSVMDSQESTDAIERMSAPEGQAWETLIDNTEEAIRWIWKVEAVDKGDPIVTVQQLLARMLVDESTWLQARLTRGQGKAEGPKEERILIKRAGIVKAAVRRYLSILWKNGGCVSAPLVSLEKAIGAMNAFIQALPEKKVKAKKMKAKTKGQPSKAQGQTAGKQKRLNRSNTDWCQKEESGGTVEKQAKKCQTPR